MMIIIHATLNVQAPINKFGSQSNDPNDTYDFDNGVNCNVCEYDDGTPTNPVCSVSDWQFDRCRR